MKNWRYSTFARYYNKCLNVKKVGIIKTTNEELNQILKRFDSTCHLKVMKRPGINARKQMLIIEEKKQNKLMVVTAKKLKI